MGNGGYYRLSDASGPYAIDSSGNAKLLSTGASPVTFAETGLVTNGYWLGKGGYYAKADASGPYCIDGASIATLI